MNELEKRAKKHRKKLRGMSSFSTLNAGNVEHNIAMFNAAATPNGGPSLSPVGPMGESLDNKSVELYYEKLPITIEVGGSSGGYFDTSFGNWLPDDPDQEEVTIDYSYEADRMAVEEFIGDKIIGDMSAAEYDALEDPDAYIADIIDKNFDSYVEKYYDELLEYFQDDAIKEAEEKYDESYFYEEYNTSRNQLNDLDENDSGLKELLGLTSLSETCNTSTFNESTKLSRNDSFDSVSDLIDTIKSRGYFANFAGSTPTTEYLDVFRTYGGPHVSIEYSENSDGSVTIVNIEGLYSDLFEGIEDDFELQSGEQEFTSKTTAYGNGKANGGYGRVPALFKASVVRYPDSGVLLDYGCGEYSTSERIKEYVTEISPDLVYVGFDKFNRSTEENSDAIKVVRQNGGANIVTCANVLNVIKEREIRVNEVIGNIYKLLKSGGTAYFDVYEAKGKVAAQTGKDKYQLFKGLDEYIEEIEEVFGPNSATRRGKVIVAVK